MTLMQEPGCHDEKPMIAHAKISRSREYYEEDFIQWRRYISRRHRWEFRVSLTAIAVGLFFFFQWHFPITGIFLIVAGLVQLILYYFQKSLWVSSKLRNTDTSPEFELFFYEDYMEISVQSFKSKVSWLEINRAFSTPIGLFLWIKQGSHIYIPKASIVPPDAFEQIVQKCSGSAHRQNQNLTANTRE